MTLSLGCQLGEDPIFEITLNDLDDGVLASDYTAWKFEVGMRNATGIAALVTITTGIVAGATTVTVPMSSAQVATCGVAEHDAELTGTLAGRKTPWSGKLRIHGQVGT